MAKLDKSQGFTFVYKDIYQLYKKAKTQKLDSPLIVNRQEEFIRPMGVVEAEEKALRKRWRNENNAVAVLQRNLSSLTKAHAKLRFFLQEIDDLTKKSFSK